MSQRVETNTHHPASAELQEGVALQENGHGVRPLPKARAKWVQERGRRDIRAWN
jgi:hypothetical protein